MESQKSKKRKEDCAIGSTKRAFFVGELGERGSGRGFSFFQELWWLGDMDFGWVIG